MLKNNITVLLLLFTVIFLKELVLEFIERPLYMHYAHSTDNWHQPLLLNPNHSFPGAKSPQRALSLPWNFRSVEHSLLGTFLLWNFRSSGECSKNFRSEEHSLPWNFRSSGANVPRTFVPMKLSFLENRQLNCHSLRTNIPRTFAPYVLKHDLKLAINLTTAYAH